MSQYPDDADGDALARIAADGVDMSQPLTLDFAIHAPSEEAARAIADSLSRKGFETSVDFDEGEEHDTSNPEEVEEFGPSWSVYAVISMVPSYDDLIRVQAELQEISEPHGGYPDGWGAMVDPAN